MGEDDGPRLVTVSCPNYHEVLVRGLWNFFTAKHGLDFEFQLGGRSVRAHRLVLEVFLSPEKLAQNPAEEVDSRCKEQILKKENDDSTPGFNLDSLFEFIYNGKVVVPEEELDDLLQLARELDFQMLADAVESAGTEGGGGSAAELCVPEITSVRSCRLKLRGRRSWEAAGSSEVDDGMVGNSDDDWETPVGKRRVARKLSDQPAEKAKKKPVRRKRSVKTEVPEDSIPSPDPASNGEEDGEAGSGSDSASEEAEWLASVELSASPERGLIRRKRSLVPGGRVSRPCELQCPQCAFVMCERSSYLYHMKAIHNVEAEDCPEPLPAPAKTFKCSECDYVCPNRSKLKTHVVCHSSEKPFRCDQCPMVFRRKGDLVRHGKEVHKRIRKYMCEICGSKFTNQFVLDRHRRTHTGEKPYLCQTCQRSFADRTTFERHVRRHEKPGEKPFMCEQCGRTFVVRYNLNAHVKRCHKSLVLPPHLVPQLPQLVSDPIHT